MDFGRVPSENLINIDFKLIADPIFNENVLQGKPVADPKVYIGCAKWGRTEWVGKLYPSKAKEKDFLTYYTDHYNCIEFNATHYKVYDGETIKKWTEKTADRDFKFCLKMYQGVTHRGSLKGKDFILKEFFRGIAAFEEFLGPIFIQVSETFAPKRKQELFDFLKSMPKDFQFFMEVRHPNWFSNPDDILELFSLLARLNMGAVITDTAGRRDCAHMHLTMPKSFIRFIGNGLDPTDFTRIDDWVERIKYWFKNGLEELYFFIHMHDEAKSPELTVYLVDKLNAALGLNLMKPKFISKKNYLINPAGG